MGFAAGVEVTAQALVLPPPPPKKNKRGLGATSAGDVNRGDLPLRFASVEKLAAFPRVSL